MKVLERFLKYISIPTNSNSETNESPSTKTQWSLARLLADELKELNVDEVYLDEKYCYVYAKIKGNDDSKKIGFIAHMDTAEDVTDENVKPNIIENYNGEDVVLNDNVILEVNKYPDLKKHIGKTLITTDGTTLLGADDKSGIAEIMTMIENIKNSDIEHGDIYICFTPDEEIGEGTIHFDFDKFKADFAYTVDGSDLGEICFENFNAATIKINITGKSIHLGSAKGILVNSQLIANEIINLIPKQYPETTEGYEGYYHVDSIKGDITNTKLTILIRDFEKEGFENRKNTIKDIVNNLNVKYNNCIVIEINDSYYNMKDIISNHIELIDNVKKAMNNLNIEPIVTPIRGGTDGARLTELGLPCPNLGTGGHNFHGIYEYITLQDMEKVVDILMEIVKINSKNEITK